MADYSLGIDTSNYKTSIAITDSNGGVVFEKSEFLEVEQGSRGLRQSVAFYMHSNVLPQFISDALSHVDVSEIRSVAVSDKPRNVEGSYMPVFLAGLNAGRILASALEIPLYTFSHQEGHIASIIKDISAEELDDRFIVFHLSGGTTECLLCNLNGSHIDAEIIGGTLDISIGQLLDRAGVKLGFSFPAGKYLDEIAVNEEVVSSAPKKIKLRDGYFNLSGTETEVMRNIEEHGAEIIPGLFRRLTELLYTTAAYLASEYGVTTVYLAGGVAASRYVRTAISKLSAESNNSNFRIVFGDSILSGDNAVGISILGMKEYNNTRTEH